MNCKSTPPHEEMIQCRLHQEIVEVNFFLVHYTLLDSRVESKIVRCYSFPFTYFLRTENRTIEPVYFGIPKKAVFFLKAKVLFTKLCIHLLEL